MKMQKSINEHLKILGYFVFIFILYYFVVHSFRNLLQHQSSIAYFSAIFIVFLFAILVCYFYYKIMKINIFNLDDINGNLLLQVLSLCISQFLLISVFFGHPIFVNKQILQIENIIFCIHRILFISIVSEILFRGLLQRQLLKITKPWLAILITTVVSMFVNIMYIPSMIEALLCGIFIGIIYYKTKKIILCIIYRSFFSLLCTLFPFSIIYIINVQLVSLFLAIFLATYSIKRFLKYNTNKKR